ncbi:hypothetical protein KC960_02600 [Candidatus Saccharibacteria bacterium]|nr:hypothetical protein [Candidatus Saccharibacteria bacterium]
MLQLHPRLEVVASQSRTETDLIDFQKMADLLCDMFPQHDVTSGNLPSLLDTGSMTANCESMAQAANNVAKIIHPNARCYRLLHRAGPYVHNASVIYDKGRGFYLDFRARSASSPEHINFVREIESANRHIFDRRLLSRLSHTQSSSFCAGIACMGGGIEIFEEYSDAVEQLSVADKVVELLLPEDLVLTAILSVYRAGLPQSLSGTKISGYRLDSIARQTADLLAQGSLEV